MQHTKKQAIIKYMPRYLKALTFATMVIVLALSPNNHSVIAQTDDESKFDTIYNVKYQIFPSGETKITQEVSIINKQGDLVATNYSLTVKNMEIYDVYGSDAEGDLDINLETESNSTKINTKFNDQVIGIDRKLDWVLEYKTKDISTKVGEVWNINIPRVEVLGATSSYNVTLVVPKSFGPEIYVSPHPAVKNIDQPEFYTYTFTKDELMQRGISASFGNYQIINFSLKYNLKNENSLSGYQDIALPPDIRNKQQVQFLNIDPKPSKIFTDKDGNLMATYNVPDNSQLEITAFGSARISGTQINPEFGGKKSKIPKNLINAYTKADTFWEVDSDAIQKVASDLYSEDLTTSQNAQNAYNYVVNKLEYNLEAEDKSYINRNGALNALIDSGPWACMEFTDLFIAITRAMGIPSRELNGYAITHENSLTPLSISLKGGDLLHSWAEFYDPSFGWIQVDPTWGNTSKTDYFTKLDTNHFVFVIKGYDSEYPYPAGTYKITGDESQVDVEVAQETVDTAFKEKFEIYRRDLLNPLNWIAGRRVYTIFNSGGVKIYNVNNTGRDLNPFTSMSIKLPSGSEQIKYENFYGETKDLDLKITPGKPPKNNSDANSIFLGVFAGLLLCSLIYGLAIRPKFLERLLHRRRRRPQDQDQSQNQNSK